MEELDLPRRRGRAPMSDTPAPVLETGETNTPGRRRRSRVGGHAFKLTAAERPGYVRRWVNDTNNRIAEAQELAYDFVSDPAIQSTGEGSRISRLVGTKANGEPLRAYLMETPVEEYRAGVAEKEAELRQIDEAMHGIVDETGQSAPRGEQYGQVSIKRD